jgi:divalent metal cation (Fe/Co/Zn/Cd) transporter
MRDAVTTPTQSPRVLLAQRVRTLSWLTVAWLAVDGAVGMTAGIAANSVALIGWGLDCAIEAAAALVVIWRFTGVRVDSIEAEALARRVVGVSFFLLVPYIVVGSVDQLVSGGGARGSWIGIVLAATDAALMPLLGRAKKRLGTRLESAATAGAGHQNILCAYLSGAVLVGLAANLTLGWWWADPVVAFLVAVACLQAGWNTWRGEACDDPVAG